MKWANRQIKKALLLRQGAENRFVDESCILKYNGANETIEKNGEEIANGKRADA